MSNEPQSERTQNNPLEDRPSLSTTIPDQPLLGQPSTSLSPTSVALTTSIDLPETLRKFDASSIRLFLRQYDAYVTSIHARAAQLGSSSYSALPIGLKYCVDASKLEAAINQKLIAEVSDYNSLTDECLRLFLEEEIEEDGDQLSLDEIDNIMSKGLSMDMRNRNAKSRMRNLFIDYQALLTEHNIEWVIADHPKLAADHIISAVKPHSLQKKLRDTCNLRKKHLKKDFIKFREYALELAIAFRLLDNGPRPQSNRGNTIKNTIGTSINSNPSPSNQQNNQATTNGKSQSETTSQRSRSRPLPPCPFPSCLSKGLRHWIVDCTASNDDEKKKMKEQLAEIKKAKGPASSTRSKSSAGQNESNSGTARRIIQPNQSSTNAPSSSSKPSGLVKFSSGVSMIEATGRFDDGSDDTLASASVAERAAKQNIGTLQPIPRTTLSMPVTSTSQPPSTFTCSRKWIVPRTMIEVASGNLCLLNIAYMVVDGELSTEDVLIGRPILEHLRIDTNTLILSNYDRINNTDCASVPNPTSCITSTVRRIETSPSSQQEASEISTRPLVNYHQARTESDFIYDPSLLEIIDESQVPDIKAGIKNMLTTAINNGIQLQHQDNLRRLTYSFIDIFRTAISATAPANLPPLKVELTPDAKPVRVRLRNYSPPQRQFLKEFVSKLIQAGMVYSNPTSPWAAAPVIVPKPNTTTFRFTVDLRPSNNYTIKYQYPMPNLEHDLLQLNNANCFAKFDLSHAYWQLPLDPGSQYTQSFVTPDGVFTPTRVLHGTTNAVLHLQSSLSAAFPPSLTGNSLIWLDDILLHASTTYHLLDIINIFFNFCRSHNLFLHPEKCILYTKSIRWCGRIISAQGIRFDPTNISALESMSYPTTAAQLQQFICAMQWLRTAIPQFAALVAPLHAMLEKAYHINSSRTKRLAARIHLSSIGWGPSECQAFDACKHAIRNQITLAHRDYTKRLCLFTDASDTIWAAFLSQVPPSALHLPVDQQPHEPLAFLSGRFNDTQLRWSTLEKEAFAIVTATRRLHWLLATNDGFDIFTDHNNIVFIFDPLSLTTDLSQSSVRKVLRWAVLMSLYNYTCVHIKGKHNIWADLLTRWTTTAHTVRRLVRLPPLVTATAQDFQWPSIYDIQEQQNIHKDEAPPSVFVQSDILYTHPSIVWIPPDSSDLQLRICIVAHTSAAGHRGKESTLHHIQQFFFWETLKIDVHRFVNACLHCVSTLRGGREPRPYGPALHGLAPNDLLQFDFLEMCDSATGMKYILMVRDDFSGYSWLVPFANADSENAADGLLEWSSTFTIPKGLMTDGGSHFRNETVRRLTRDLRVPHHFTLPYTPWSNGAVERLGKEILRIFRATLSEYQMSHQEWPALVPLLQSALNNSPSPQRKNFSPVTIFTGLTPTLPLSSYELPSPGEIQTLDAVKLTRLLEVDKVRALLDDIHPLVAVTLETERERARKSQSRGKLPHFEIGDYVLVAREDFGASKKLCLRWRGPRQITAIVFPFVYTVRDLRNDHLDDIHICRLRYYQDSSLNCEAILSHVLYSETGMEISRLLNLEDTSEGIKVKIRWKGLSSSEDTHEPLLQVYEDVPAMVKRLLNRKSIPKGIARRAKRALGL